MTRIKLQMSRNGDFFVHATGDATNQCGKRGTVLLSYRVTLKTDGTLDSRGFIVDNNSVHEYFEKKYARVRKFESCEVIARDACEHFRNAIPGVLGIEVAISGNPEHAWLTATWNKPRLRVAA